MSRTGFSHRAADFGLKGRLKHSFELATSDGEQLFFADGQIRTSLNVDPPEHR